MKKLHIIKYATIIVMGSLLSIFVFFGINNKYREKNRTDIVNIIGQSELKLKDELNKIDLIMKSIGYFFETSAVVSQGRFERFTAPFLNDLYGVLAFEWVEKTNLPNPNGNVLPWISGPHNDSTSHIKVRHLQYPVRLYNQQPSLSTSLGSTVNSNPSKRSSINKSILTKKVTLTSPIDLIEGKDVPGFLAIKSVFDTTATHAKGVVVAAFRMDEFVNKVLTDELKIFNLSIKDIGAHNSHLYDSGVTNTAYSSEVIKPIIRKIRAGDRLWLLDFTPKLSYYAFPHVLESYMVLILGLITTYLAVYILRKHYEYSERLEARVVLRTSELKRSNEEKENLLKEIHHRVKNNLQITSSLINMQKRKLTSKEAISALEDSQARISAIALTHQKMYQDKDAKAVSLEAYLNDLLEYQNKIATNFGYKIDCPKISLELDRAVPLALIISELVTNAVKHAFPDPIRYNEIHIKVKRSDKDRVSMVISDNGKGLPDDFEIDKAKGIGFEIIKALCRQISSELDYETSSTGTSFKISFKNVHTADEQPLSNSPYASLI